MIKLMPAYNKYDKNFKGEFCIVPVNAIIFNKVGNRMPLPYNWTIRLPYESRPEYLEAVQKLNQVVPPSGCITLFVDNSPYHLESYLVIESPIMQEGIDCIIKNYSLKRVFDRGLPEFMAEISDRNWNFFEFPPYDDNAVKAAFNTLFIFAEKESIENRGYHPENKKERPRLFISYSHSDKQIVSKVVAYMKQHGFNCWWDEQEIDAGDSIVERVHEGMRDCTLAIVFISKATKSAMFAQHESRTFLQGKYIVKGTGLLSGSTM